MTNEELKKIVGRNVRKYRLIYNAYNKDKLTQKGLAEKIGARTPLIGALESENNNIGVSIYNLYMISKVLNVPITAYYLSVTSNKTRVAYTAYGTEYQSAS